MGFCKNIMQAAVKLKSDKVLCLMGNDGAWNRNPTFTLDFGEVVTLIGTYAYGKTVTPNVYEFVTNRYKIEYSVDGNKWVTTGVGKLFVDARYVRMTNDYGSYDRYIEGMALGVKKSGGGVKTLLKRLFTTFLKEGSAKA